MSEATSKVSTPIRLQRMVLIKCRVKLSHVGRKSIRSQFTHKTTLYNKSEFDCFVEFGEGSFSRAFGLCFRDNTWWMWMCSGMNTKVLKWDRRHQSKQIMCLLFLLLSDRMNDKQMQGLFAPPPKKSYARVAVPQYNVLKFSCTQGPTKRSLTSTCLLVGAFESIVKGKYTLYKMPFVDGTL